MGPTVATIVAEWPDYCGMGGTTKSPRESEGVPAAPIPTAAMVTAPSSSPSVRLIAAVRTWPGASVHPQPDGSLSFRVGTAAIGVLRPAGELAVPLPPVLREPLLDSALTLGPTARPTADWVTASPDHSGAPLRLLRLSYLYRRLLRAGDADALRHVRVALRRADMPAAVRTVYEALLARREAAVAPPGRPPVQPS